MKHNGVNMLSADVIMDQSEGAEGAVSAPGGGNGLNVCPIPPPTHTKDSDNSVESSVTITNFENVDTNVSASDPGKNGEITTIQNGDSFNLGTESGVLNDTKELYDPNETEATEKWTVPEGYEFLPEELFQFEEFPPPLVTSSWLKLLNSDEESGEDSIPLARLKKILRKKRRLKKTDKSKFVNSNNACEERVEKRRKKSENAYLPINRKRGRPKKHLTENSTKLKENEFESTEPEPFWSDESDASNHGTQNPVEVNANMDFENPADNALTSSYNEHDYFKPVENESAKEVEVKDREEKKKEKTRRKKSVIQGVKIGDSKISFPCLECGKSFGAASTLKSHQRIHNGTLLICPECHKGFINKYWLKCHMRIHNGDLLMCHKCGRGFTTAELLKVHSRAHTGDRPFVCNICGKSFPTSSNMLQHKEIHNSEKKFLCSQCGSSFSQSRCLEKHMVKHAEKKNICNVCGKLWARKSDLIEHMRVHTGVKPYCCSLCPQKFSQASSLKRHQLVHMDVKPIQCVPCNKMFKCQEYYKRHIKKHKNEDYVHSNT